LIQYPIHFSTQATTPGGIQTSWPVRSAECEMQLAIPTEFEGPGGALSPEDLFAQALTNCFIATFKVLAEKSRVNFEKLDVSGRLTVERDEAKRPVMKAFHFVIELVAPSDADRAKRLVDKALESGFILNSVKTEITHEVVVR
jgi:organic hydroperoxide reductase OsmC/OhrA